MSFPVALAYTVLMNVGVVCLYWLALGTAAEFVTPRTRTSRWRLGRLRQWLWNWWSRCLPAALLVGLGFLIPVVVAAVAGVASETDVDEVPGVWIGALAVTSLVVPICLIGVLVHFGVFYRRRTHALRTDEGWDIWLGEGWQDRIPRKVALAAWQWKAVTAAATIAAVLDTLPFFYDLARGAASDENARVVADSRAGVTYIPLMLLAIVLAGAVLIWTTVRSPQLFLMEQAVAALDTASPPKELPQDAVASAPTRWRGVRHRRAFRMARSLRRCVPRTRRRLPRDQYDEFAVASARVAHELQRLGPTARAGDAGDAVDEEFTALVRAAVALVVADDPLRVAATVNYFLEDVPASSYGSGRQARVVADTVSDSVQRYWPALKIIAGVGVLLALVVTGQLTDLAEFIKN